MERSFASAKAFNQRALVCLGLPVSGDRIDDASQLAAERGHDLRAGRIVRPVDPLIRIGGEIEQLEPVADILVILPAALAQHECAGGGANGMVLEEACACRIWGRATD